MAGKNTVAWQDTMGPSFEEPENPEYDVAAIKQPTANTPAYAELFNDIFQKLINNTAAVKRLAEEAVPASQKGIANGAASLDENGKIPKEQIPALDYILTSQKGIAGGTASLDSSGKVPKAQIPALDYVPTSQRGAANGVASLDANSKIPAAQIPALNADVLAAGTLPVARGGTGAANAATARANLGAAPVASPVFTGSVSLGRKGGTKVGRSSVALGSNATSSGDSTVSLGDGNAATGNCSFAEGQWTVASGVISHAEGFQTKAEGAQSHAEGGNTKATATNAHAEGSATTATEYAAHAEGTSTVASGYSSHAEGNGATASGSFSHAEGGTTTASGSFSHAEGNGTSALGSFSHAEGNGTTALGDYSHAEGSDTTASGSFSHAEGASGTASGKCSHVEGGLYTAQSGNKATEYAAHAEGTSTVASGSASHAEGSATTASGNYSHSEGDGTVALGVRSHAEGMATKAYGIASHAAGEQTITEYWAETAVGRYNTKYAPSSYNLIGNLFVVGKGTSDSARANAFRVNTAGVYGTAAFNASGADYAELFEWADGNPEHEDRAGHFVTLDGEKIRIATPADEYVLGIISGSPSVVGDVYDDQWAGMFETDIFGRPVWEDVDLPAETREDPDPENPGQSITREIVPARTEHRQKVNPDYDSERKYTPRTERPEWDAVGLLGKLVAVDDGSCQANGWCKVGEGGIAVRSEQRTPYRVMARLDDTHIRILLVPSY